MRVSNGDGTYYLSLDDSDLPTEPAVRGAITWEYQGQAVFDADSSRRESGPFWVSSSGSQDTELDELYGTTRVDDLGRRWAVIDIDGPEACRAAEMSGSCDLDAARDDTSIEEGWWTPNAWTVQQCIGISYGSLWDSTEYVWNNESRNSVGSTFLPRQQKSVAIFIKNKPGIDYLCSGAVVGQHTILTAAHCVAPAPSGNPVNPNTLAVCTRGNMHVVSGQSDCSNVIDISIPNWSGTGAKKDFAVIEVIGDMEQAVGKMKLSSASASQIMAAKLHNVAYPLVEPNCNGINLYNPGHFDPDFVGVQAYHQSGRATKVNPKTIRTTFDSADGHSGSIIFKCPGSSCEPGEQPWAVQVWSGFIQPPGSAPGYQAGASVPAHRTWIANHL